MSVSILWTTNADEIKAKLQGLLKTTTNVEQTARKLDNSTQHLDKTYKQLTSTVDRLTQSFKELNRVSGVSPSGQINVLSSKGGTASAPSLTITNALIAANLFKKSPSLSLPNFNSLKDLEEKYKKTSRERFERGVELGAGLGTEGLLTHRRDKYRALGQRVFSKQISKKLPEGFKATEPVMAYIPDEPGGSGKGKPGIISKIGGRFGISSTLGVVGGAGATLFKILELTSQRILENDQRRLEISKSITEATKNAAIAAGSKEAAVLKQEAGGVLRESFSRRVFDYQIDRNRQLQLERAGVAGFERDRGLALVRMRAGGIKGGPEKQQRYVENVLDFALKGLQSGIFSSFEEAVSTATPTILRGGTEKGLAKQATKTFGGRVSSYLEAFKKPILNPEAVTDVLGRAGRLAQVQKEVALSEEGRNRAVQAMGREIAFAADPIKMAEAEAYRELAVILEQKRKLAEKELTVIKIFADLTRAEGSATTQYRREARLQQEAITGIGGRR